MKNEAIKQKDGISGFKTCPEWLKKKYREAVKYTCQGCHKHEDEVGKLQPHRVTRGHKGGLYTVWPIGKKGSNVEMKCDKCHKQIHKGENVQVSRSW